MAPSLYNLIVLGLTTATGSFAATATDPAVKLPDFEVIAHVDLLPTGHYHMIEQRFGSAAVAVGSNVYIFGGCASQARVLDSIELFDTRSGSSRIVGRMLRPRMWHQAALVGDKIYVLGGDGRFKSNGDFDDTMEVFDLKTFRSEYGKPMPEGRSLFAAVAYEENIYVMGGTRQRVGARTQTNRVFIYDTVSANWREGDAMPTPRNPAAALVDGGFIVVAGGYNGRNPVRAVESFDPRARAWVRLPELCAERSAHSMAYLNNRLFLFGDYTRPDEVMVYDLRTKLSQVIPIAFSAARHGSLALVDGTIYIIGGKVDSERDALDLIQAFRVPPKSTKTLERSSNAATQQFLDSK